MLLITVFTSASTSLSPLAGNLPFNPSPKISATTACERGAGPRTLSNASAPHDNPWEQFLNGDDWRPLALRGEVGTKLQRPEQVYQVDQVEDAAELIKKIENSRFRRKTSNEPKGCLVAVEDSARRLIMKEATFNANGRHLRSMLTPASGRDELWVMVAREDGEPFSPSMHDEIKVMMDKYFLV